MKLERKSNKIKLNKQLIYPLGVLIVLLLLANFVFKKDESFSKSSQSYYDEMPEKYVSLLHQSTFKDSTFFARINDDYANRELFIIKSCPTKQDQNAVFDINVQGKNGSDSLEVQIKSPAVLFHYEGKVFAVYRQQLPFIDIKDVSIKYRNPNNKVKPWSLIINDFPFSEVKVSSEEFKQINTHETLQLANGYQRLFLKLCAMYEVKHLPQGLIKTDSKLYRTEQRLSDYKDEESKVILEIKDSNLFLDALFKRDKNIGATYKFTGPKDEKVTTLFSRYNEDKLNLNSVLDLDKLVRMEAIKKLFSINSRKLFLSYNDTTKRFEPLFVKVKLDGSDLKFIRRSLFHAPEIVNQYVSALESISTLDLKEDIIDKDNLFESKVTQFNASKMDNMFDIFGLQRNQRVIQKELNPSSVIKINLLDVNQNNITFKVLNFSDFEVKIKGINHKKKLITSLDEPFLIPSQNTDTISFSLPRSFENLFVNKKTKQTGFILHKHIYDLFVDFEVNGNKRTSQITPYLETENIEVDIFRNGGDIKEIPNISINENQKTITFSEEKIVLSQPLIIPQGYKFILKAGTKLDIQAGGKVISHGPLLFQGKKNKPIYIISSDNKGQGFLVLSAGKRSNLEHVIFDGLRNPIHGSWSVTGAVTFYESPVTLTKTIVKNNHCEDALNIVRTDFILRGSRIEGTQSDAFDGDFVTGRIVNCEFHSLGNDAIDVSGSNILIKDVIVKNAQDKGLSAGEDSQMKIRNVEVYNSEIAVAGKDLSIVDIKDFNVFNTKLGFTAFQKKPEFGPSDIKVINLKLEGVEIDYLIESSSSLFVEGKKIETSENVKDRMYGVEFGRSSAETRNVQNN
ncbi:DUF3365 domain-containing protein [Flavobacteriaceae bacterium]|nr:DUF3365 domain-containing protein [Flavobacteriaceae bacterium]